jgi:hypothetical protein
MLVSATFARASFEALVIEFAPFPQRCIASRKYELLNVKCAYGLRV